MFLFPFWRQKKNKKNIENATFLLLCEYSDNDEKNNLCECYTWHRASNNIEDDDEQHENATGSTMQKQTNFQNVQQSNGTDSGCDSDCPENISELCKKFDENLSEQDVSDNNDSKKKRYRNQTHTKKTLYYLCRP